MTFNEVVQHKHTVDNILAYPHPLCYIQQSNLDFFLHFRDEAMYPTSRIEIICQRTLSTLKFLCNIFSQEEYVKENLLQYCVVFREENVHCI